MADRKFKITYVSHTVFLLDRNDLNEEANCPGNSFHTLILILIGYNFAIQAHGMENISREVISYQGRLYL